MSRLRLTKLVTVLPYFVVVNNSPHSLRYMEDNEQADLWNDSAPNQVRQAEQFLWQFKRFVNHNR